LISIGGGGARDLVIAGPIQFMKIAANLRNGIRTG